MCRQKLSIGALITLLLTLAILEHLKLLLPITFTLYIRFLVTVPFPLSPQDERSPWQSGVIHLPKPSP